MAKIQVSGMTLGVGINLFCSRFQTLFDLSLDKNISVNLVGSQQIKKIANEVFNRSLGWSSLDRRIC
jgi:hypothetical protein